MSQITAHLSMSLDGFVAGPDQSEEDPIGVGGMALHRWHLEEPMGEADRRMSDRILAPRGAYVMGRNMFGPIRGEWGDADWRGWWGPEPPYHAPVFVLSHHPHEPIEMEGGTTFTSSVVSMRRSSRRPRRRVTGSSPLPVERARCGRGCGPG